MNTHTADHDLYTFYQSQKLAIDMTRGKPSSEQLDLSWPMLTQAPRERYRDYRNYGFLEGIPEARILFAGYLGTPIENTWVLGNSSLSVMHDLVVQMLLTGPLGEKPWSEQARWGRRPVMLCPVPGYDRHFAICQHSGIDMCPVPLKDDGPDMDVVERLVLSQQGNVVGMWCTPKYSNPTGITYSQRVCERFAKMQTAYPAFRIFWDLAYQMHHLAEAEDELPNLFELCKHAGNEDRPLIIGSTSKITFAGSGVAMLAASMPNLEWFSKARSVQTIGDDKLNQLRHVDFLQNVAGIRRHMRAHARILRPKFDAVCTIFAEELGGRNIAWWNEPRGGYFIALRVLPGCAGAAIEQSGKLGVRFTPAGAMHPYGEDPKDEWIRVAPTFPPLAQVETAARVLSLCVRLAARK